MLTDEFAKVNHLDYDIYTMQEFFLENISKPLDTIVAIAVIIVSVSILYLVIAFILRRSKHEDAMKYEFITIVAHKFHTPLTHIKWLSENLLGEETDHYRLESLREIKNANEKLINLTGTLIETVDASSGSKTSYHLEKIEIGDFIEKLIDKAKTYFHEKNIFLSVEYPKKMVFVNADRSRLEFALNVLLENAMTYTPVGKNVDVRIFEVWHKVFIEVKDAGIGIKSEDLPIIFSKFFRAKNARAVDTEGFGVGLYLAQAIIKKHHGKIKVHSDGENKGATFTVMLPEA